MVILLEIQNIGFKLKFNPKVITICLTVNPLGVNSRVGKQLKFLNCKWFKDGNFFSKYTKIIYLCIYNDMSHHISDDKLPIIQRFLTDQYVKQPQLKLRI